MTSTLPNAGMNNDARTFTVTVNIPEPLEDQEIEITAYAEFQHDLVRMRSKCSVGDFDVRCFIQGEAVDFDDSDSFGRVNVTTGALNLSTPDGNASNSHCYVGEKVTIYIDNVTSFSEGGVIQLTFRRTQTNTT